MNPHPPDLESGALAVRATGLYQTSLSALILPLTCFLHQKPYENSVAENGEIRTTSSLYEGYDVGNNDNIY